MNNLRIIVLSMLLASASNALAQQQISLAGKWRFALDADSLGYKQNWSNRTLDKEITLPGTTDQAHYGTKTTGSDYGILTRAYKYIGPAWYQKDITIPENWKGQNTTLFLERVLWESKVYVDGKLNSTLSPLYTAHQHNLGQIKPGKHTLTICINNDLVHNIGDKGHGYTEYTQSIWNGIVGKIELQSHPEIAIEMVKAYPLLDKGQLDVTVSLTSAKKGKAIIRAVLTDQKGQTVKAFQKGVTFSEQQKSFQLSLPNLKNLKPWDEFTPNLYNLEVSVTQNGKSDSHKQQIGFRKVETNQHQILLNNHPIFVRGNLDCVHFPLTGYPSTKVADWERIFNLYKAYGLNTVRFHSWCPPEAAFVAADKLGIYIQAEVIWLDWWMAAPRKERPEMDTKGFPQGLGKNPSADAFVQAEMQRIIDVYGNHPSFLFFGIGNELGNSDFSVMETWLKKIKDQDHRRLYAVSTARKITPTDDYNVTHNIPNVGGTYGNTMNSVGTRFEQNYSKANIPTIAHELGQYPIYPEWTEINKYTGVLKPRNLEGFKQMAEKNGIVGQDKKFHQASGALQRLLYKNLIENILLAQSSSGYQLLSMTDYAGQGEALIGWLDSFWDSKGTTSPQQFNQYANVVVPAISTKSFVYGANSNIDFKIYVRNNFNKAIDGPVTWKFTDKTGKTVASGATKVQEFDLGKLTMVDSVSISTNIFPKTSGQYTLELSLANGQYKNTWAFFVFNKNEKTTAGNVLVTDHWDANVDETLAKGGKVLLKANRLGTNTSAHSIYFSPLFWSASFFPGQDNETLGSYIENSHPALAKFPTENYTNWQWQVASAKGRYFDLSAMPKSYQPIVQPVSDFHFNKKLGSIFETKVGKGSLLVCGYDLDLDNPSSQQLYTSLLSYAKSEKFKPQNSLPTAALKKVLEEVPTAEASKPLPNQFKDASLFVKTGAKATGEKWTAQADEILNAKGYTFTTSGVSIYQKVWDMRNGIIDVKPPQGLKGYVYLHFVNPDKKKTNGVVTIEGRELRIGEIPAEGKWIKVFMMREDTNDGQVKINIKAEDGYLQIDQFAIINED